MLFLVLIWTLNMLPIVCGRYITVDSNAPKEIVDTVLRDTENKKPSLKRHIDSHIDDKFQLNNMFDLGEMTKRSHSKSTSSPLSSSLSSLPSLETTTNILKTNPSTESTSTTVSTSAHPKMKTNRFSSTTRTPSQQPTIKPSYISPQTSQANSLSTTASLVPPATSSTVNNSLTTNDQTTGSPTTTVQTTIRNENVSVFRKKKAVTNETIKTTKVSTSLPLTTKTAASSSTDKPVRKKKKNSKCERLRKLKFPLPKSCKKQDGISVWD